MRHTTRQTLSFIFHTSLRAVKQPCTPLTVIIVGLDVPQSICVGYPYNLVDPSCHDKSAFAAVQLIADKVQASAVGRVQHGTRFRVMVNPRDPLSLHRATVIPCIWMEIKLLGGTQPKLFPGNCV